MFVHILKLNIKEFSQMYCLIMFTSSIYCIKVKIHFEQYHIFLYF